MPFGVWAFSYVMEYIQMHDNYSITLYRGDNGLWDVAVFHIVSKGKSETVYRREGFNTPTLAFEYANRELITYQERIR
jgi:hypothetical protein